MPMSYFTRISVLGRIEIQAKNVYFDVRSVISVSLEDLIQEGMIGAWTASMRYDESKVKDEESVYAYCMLRARGAMLDFINRKCKPEDSLEAYLEVKTEIGLMQREIEDKHIECTGTSPHKREALLTAISKISPQQRKVILASFNIEDEQGNITTREDTRASQHQYDSARNRGLKKLRTVLKLEDLVLA